jgi:hypothetical protein
VATDGLEETCRYLQQEMGEEEEALSPHYGRKIPLKFEESRSSIDDGQQRFREPSLPPLCRLSAGKYRGRISQRSEGNGCQASSSENRAGWIRDC